MQSAFRDFKPRHRLFLICQAKMPRLEQFLFRFSETSISAHNEPLTPIPRLGSLAGVVRPFSEHESPYAELALTAPAQSPEGGYKATPPVLDWQTTSAVALLKNLQRLTAPNPSVMTGPGTNTYIVGGERTGYIVIDPGPADTEHVGRIAHACNKDIRMIVCTHSHPDHSPGARPLQALCESLQKTRPPILGLASKETAKATGFFRPDRELTDGECLVLSCEATPALGREVHTLQIIFTPGHAANHLCLVLREDGLLFSGDHILNGSTTVVDPPDGHMGQYLDSLTKLLAQCNEHRIEFILPAHGYVLGNFWARPRSAPELIQKLYEHRMSRESKILQVIQHNPTGSMDDWVKLCYDDVPERIWPIAKRSLLAHVEHLRELGSI